MTRLLQATKMKNPTILHLCRNIIRKQNYEIWEMTMMKQQPSSSVFRKEAGVLEKATTKIDVYNPFVGNVYCNPLFFDPDAHHKQMQHHAITIKSYLEHMIPHHQVAIDMSKRLLLHTNRSYLMDLCRKLIIDQQYEISVMKDLLIQDSYKHDTGLIQSF